MRSLDTNSAIMGVRDGSCDASIWAPASTCWIPCIRPGRPPAIGDDGAPGAPDMGGAPGGVDAALDLDTFLGRGGSESGIVANKGTWWPPPWRKNGQRTSPWLWLGCRLLIAYPWTCGLRDGRAYCHESPCCPSRLDDAPWIGLTSVWKITEKKLFVKLVLGSS